jgi:hypothetical protein
MDTDTSVVTTIPFGSFGDIPVFQPIGLALGTTPTIAAVMHDVLHRPFPSGTALAGSGVHPVIAVSGGQGTPTGSVTFRWYVGLTCSGDATPDIDWALDAGGVAHPSGVTVLPPPGMSLFVQYAGDASYTAASRCAPLAVRSAISFTDALLIPRSTPVKAAHVVELRALIDGVRGQNGLPAYGWTDPALAAGVTRIRAAHVAELRAAIEEAYTAAARTAPTWTDPALAQGATTVKATHINEIRFVLTQDW